jgi:hypothetical protein
MLTATDGALEHLATVLDERGAPEGMVVRSSAMKSAPCSSWPRTFPTPSTAGSSTSMTPKRDGN